MRLIFRIQRDILRAVPVSGIIGALNYIIEGILPAVMALLMGKLFDSVSMFLEGAEVRKEILVYSGSFLLSYVIIYVVQVISNITINAGVYDRCKSFYEQKLLEKTAKLPMPAFEDSRILDMQKRAKECIEEEIPSQIYMLSVILISGILGIFSTMSVMLMYSGWFVLASLVSVLPYCIARLIRGKEFYKLKFFQTPKERKVNYFWNLFGDRKYVKEMRVMDSESYLEDKWKTMRDQVYEEVWSFQKKDARILLVCDVFRILGYALSILIAVWLAAKGTISIGVFGACIAAFRSMQNAVKECLVTVGSLSEKLIFAGDYDNFMELSEEQNGKLPMAGLKEKIVLENVSFSYPNNEEPAVKDVSITINKGETVVVLGVNGSGKTTLAKLLLGLYQPDFGNIWYDGILLKDLDKQSFYRQVTAVTQDFGQYHLSLRENVAISELEYLADDERILAALDSVGLKQLAEQGLAVQMGREFAGKDLSGGQWQKLAISRGIFKNSEMIILDEPTSALDPVVETEILRQFLKMTKEKTTVIISHRAGLCQYADKILVMKKGELCEAGTHQELMQNNGEYRQLFDAQKKWYVS